MKTRLNKTSRERLHDYAIETILPNKEKKATSKAYKAMLKSLQSLYQKSFTEQEIKTLRKFDCSDSSRYIKIHVEDPAGNRVVDIELNKEDGEQFVVPKKKWDQYKIGVVSSKSVLFRQIKTYEKAKLAEEKASRQIFKDMNALITTSRTFEDVVEIWQGAESLRSEICSPNTAICALSQEAIGRIKIHISK